MAERKNTKRYATHSFQNGKWCIWSYARDDKEYTKYVEDMEKAGFTARVTDRETKEVIYITK